MRDVDPMLFPNVVGALQEAGLDPTRELVPVAPAAHYGMGGIVSDLDGATTVPGLYAVGESACTGLHGANRLASNSLSECFVFGARAARAAAERAAASAPGEPPAPRSLPAPSRASREALWRDAGLVRTREGLERLRDDPYPLVAPDRRPRAPARGDPRRPHARRLPADRPRARPPPLRQPRARRRPVYERWT